jgi:hypothetical protein
MPRAVAAQLAAIRGAPVAALSRARRWSLSQRNLKAAGRNAGSGVHRLN